MTSRQYFKQIAGFIMISSLFLGVGEETAVSQDNAFAARAESTAAPAAADKSGAHAEILKDIQQLVHNFYPKAKITATADKTHFEYKTKQEVGYYSGNGQSILVPADGGIIGTLSFESGEYDGKDKAELPSVIHDGFHTILVMAPYSKASNQHLLAKLVYPEDAHSDFISKFKETVAKFGDRPTPKASTPSASEGGPTGDQVATASTPSATNAPPGWHVLRPDGLGFSVLVPKVVQQPKMEKMPGTATEPMYSYTYDIEDGDLGFHILVFKFPKDSPIESDSMIHTMMQQKLQGMQGLKPVTLNGCKGYQGTVAGKTPTQAYGFGTSGFGYLFMSTGPSGPASVFLDSIKVEGKQVAPWKQLSCPDVHLTAQIPSQATYAHKTLTDGAYSMWVGQVGGMMYLVAYVEKVGPFSAAAARSTYIDTMAKDTLSSNQSSKMEKAFTFQGLPAKQFSFEAKDHNTGECIVCVGNTSAYIFQASTFATMKYSKTAADNFFNNIKLTEK